MTQEQKGNGLIPWAGGEGPNAWKMNRFLRSQDTVLPVDKQNTLSQELIEGVEVELPTLTMGKGGKGNDLGNPQLW